MISNEKVISAEVFNISGASPDLIRESYFQFKLIVPDGTFHINQLKIVDITRDYVNSYCDYIDIEFSMPLGDFIYHVYKDRDDIEAVLTSKVVGSSNTERLVVTLHTIDEQIRTGRYDAISQEELNKDMTLVRIQCINKTVNELRNKVTHGIYRKATVSSVMNTVMLKELNAFSALHGLVSNGMKMVPADNSREYEHILIPAGTKVLGLPKFLQNNQYGVYNGDIATYLQTYNGTETLFIGPKYRTNLISHYDTKLYIVATTSAVLAGITSTYAKDNEFIKILVERNNAIFDDDNKVKDKGTAIITTESDALLARPVEISKTSMKVSEDSVTNKIAHKEVSGGVGPIEYKGVTNNQYTNRTNGLMRDGVIVQASWKSSNSRLLTPLMPVVYIIEKEGKLLRYEGVLQRVDTMVVVSNKTESSLLTLFLSKVEGLVSVKEKIKIF